jgi:hypothetical protein
MLRFLIEREGEHVLRYQGVTLATDAASPWGQRLQVWARHPGPAAGLLFLGARVRLRAKKPQRGSRKRGLAE